MQFIFSCREYKKKEHMCAYSRESRDRAILKRNKTKQNKKKEEELVMRTIALARNQQAKENKIYDT